MATITAVKGFIIQAPGLVTNRNSNTFIPVIVEEIKGLAYFKSYVSMSLTRMPNQQQPPSIATIFFIA